MAQRKTNRKKCSGRTSHSWTLGCWGVGGCLNHLRCELHKTNTANVSNVEKQCHRLWTWLWVNGRVWASMCWNHGVRSCCQKCKSLIVASKTLDEPAGGGCLPAALPAHVRVSNTEAVPQNLIAGIKHKYKQIITGQRVTYTGAITLSFIIMYGMI